MGASEAVRDEVRRILGEIEAEHRAWTDLMAGLDPGDPTTTSDGWSIPQTAAHVAAWKKNALRIARLQGEPGAPALDPDIRPSQVLGIDVDRFNEQFFADPEPWTHERAVRWSQEIHGKLVDALLALPPERILGGSSLHGARLWFIRPSVIHSREHRDDAERSLGR